MSSKPRGTFIVIEARDDQLSQLCFEQLSERLKNQGLPMVVMNFAHDLTEQANGTFSAADAAQPLLDSAGTIKQALDDGQVVLAHGYSGLLMMQSANRSASQPANKGHYLWLSGLLYDEMKLPVPDSHFLLSNAEDQLAMDVAAVFQKDVTWLNIERNGQQLDVPTLVNHVWRAIQADLPLQRKADRDAAGSIQKYGVPEGLSAPLTEAYRTTLDKIIEIHGLLKEQFGDQAASVVLPIATRLPRIGGLISVGNVLPDSIKLPASTDFNYGVKLKSTSYRKELDLLPLLIFELSDISLEEASRVYQSLPIGDKIDLFKAYITDTTAQALSAFTYQFEVFAETSQIVELTDLVKPELMITQSLTPRYGYDIPSVIEEAGMSDSVEACFDLSLHLHSNLIAGDASVAAQTVTLMGHRNRWLVSFKSSDLLQGSATLRHHALGRELIAQIQGAHPMLGELLVATD